MPYSLSGIGFIGSHLSSDRILSLYVSDHIPDIPAAGRDTHVSRGVCVQSASANTSAAVNVGATANATAVPTATVTTTANTKVEKVSKPKNKKAPGSNQNPSSDIPKANNTKPGGKKNQKPKKAQSADVDQLTAAVAQMSVSAGNSSAAERHTRPKAGQSVGQKPKQAPKGSAPNRKLTANPSPQKIVAPKVTNTSSESVPKAPPASKTDPAVSEAPKKKRRSRRRKKAVEQAPPAVVAPGS